MGKMTIPAYGIDSSGNPVYSGDFVIAKAILYSTPKGMLYLAPNGYIRGEELYTVVVEVFGQVEGGHLKNVICLDKNYSLHIFNAYDNKIPVEIVNFDVNLSHQLRVMGGSDERIKNILKRSEEYRASRMKQYKIQKQNRSKQTKTREVA